MPPGSPGRSTAENVLALLIFLLGIFIASYFFKQLFALNAAGLSLVSHKLPYWDFTNLWAAGKLAMSGRVGTIFDVDAYREALRLMFNPALPDQEWSYPPSMLLLGAPFSLLPIFWSYVAWQSLTICLLFLATRPLDLPLIARIAIILSPAALVSALFGQNGALTCALLISSLSLLPKRPIVAGILMGLLTIKPQLGVLLPICAIASRSWRAIIAATLTALALVLVTALFFGLDVWIDFWTRTRPLMTSIMDAPFPQGYQMNAATVFSSVRSLSMSLAAAHAAQAATIFLSAAAAYLLWRPASLVPHGLRVCLTGALTLLAMPYGYYYDCIPLSVTAAFLYFSGSRVPTPIIAAGFVYPLVGHFINSEGFFVGPLVFAIFTIFVFATFAREDGQEAPSGSGEGPETGFHFSWKR
ncbi:MAG: glycosyltransferase family 87 protein [Pararhizobium sp.]